MTTPALTPQQRATIIAAAYGRVVVEALRSRSNEEQRRLAQPELACEARVGDAATVRRDCLVAPSCRVAGRTSSAGSAAIDVEEEQAARS